MDKGSKQLNTRIRLKDGSGTRDEAENRGLTPRRKMSIAAVLGIVLFFLFWFSLLFIVPYRQWSLSPAYIFESIKNRFSHFYAFFTGGHSEFGVTVYQYLAVIVTGAALAACGTVFQGSFRNVLAGPSTMGVMAGGTLGFMVYLLLFTSGDASPVLSEADIDAWAGRSFFEIYGLQLFALLGCFAGVALTVGVATAAGRGRLSAPAMILSGTVFSAITGGISNLIQYYMILTNPFDTRIEAVRSLMMGSFNRVTGPEPLAMMAVPILICLGALILLRHRLNLLSLGEDEALTIGVNIRTYRYVMIAVGTIITAFVVAFCGHIGFLGFMVPLVARKLTGPDMAKLLPVAMLTGAILLTLVFDLAYICGLTDYMNLFTSSIGGVVMLVTLLRKGGAGHAAY